MDKLIYALMLNSFTTLLALLLEFLINTLAIILYLTSKAIEGFDELMFQGVVP